MYWLQRGHALLRRLFFRSRIERDLDDELTSYVDLLAAENEDRGVAPDEAARCARIALGGRAAVAEAVRAGRTGAAAEAWWRDVRHAVRGLRRTPGYAALAIALIALGVGANTAVFSVVDAAAFKPLPYKEPDRLVDIATVVGRGTTDVGFQVGMTWTSVDRWRAQSDLFEAIATYRAAQPITVADVPVSGQAFASRISPDIPSLLGIAPRIGRTFTADDARPDVHVALLAEPFWRTALHADPAILGRTLTLDDQPYLIVGVMPATLSWRVGGRHTVAWLPLDESAERTAKNRPYVDAVARLRPGLTFEQAAREIRTAVERLQPGVPANKRWDVELLPFDQRASFGTTTRRSLLILLGAVALVLLIACANVANLLLARAHGRRREMAVRAALGATRARLMRQLLIEGVVLAAGGGLVAFALVWWSAALVPTLIPDRLGLFDANRLAIDTRTFVFCVVAICLTALLSTLLPALRASRPDILRAIESGVRVAGPTSRGRQWRAGLQTIQVALTFVLLVGAGLLAASLMRMIDTPAGYDVDRLATVNVALPEPRYTPAAASAAFFDELLARTRTIPGARASYGPPPPGAFTGRFVAFGRENGPASMGSVYAVDSDYFSVAGISLKTGRLPGPQDTATSPAVAVIDERAAELFWPGQSAVGERIRTNPYAKTWMTVIGVVGSVKTTDFASPWGALQAYQPQQQDQPSPYRSLLVRSDGDPAAPLARIRDIAVSMEPAIVLTGMMPVAEMYRGVYVEPRFFSTLMAVLALLALITASVGLYGIVNYAVTERTREIGVRMALGADVTRVRRLIVGEALAPACGGIVVGLVASVFLTEYVSSLLYEVTPHDPSTFAGVVVLLVVVAAIAAFIPARRATRVDPVATLRAD